MSIVQLLVHLVHMLAQFGATHAYASKRGANGYAVTHHYLIVACKIPAHAHGVFRCSGWIRR